MAEKKQTASRFASLPLESYLDSVASTAPVPGGGGVSALAGALAGALGCMVAGLTLGKPAYADHDDETRRALDACERLRRRMLELSDADADGFVPVARALKLPRSTPEERGVRTRALDEALVGACEAPFEVLESSLSVIEALSALAEHGSKLAVVDVGVASSLARTAADGAALTVHANARMMSDRARALELGQRADELMGLAEVRSREVYVTAKLRFS